MTSPAVDLFTAKLLKEHGFDWGTYAYYGCDDPSGGTVKPNEFFEKPWVTRKDLEVVRSQSGTMIYDAPTLNRAKDWLREVHNVHVNVNHNPTDQTYRFSITTGYYHADHGVIQTHGFTKHKSYNEALSKGIIDSLEYMKTWETTPATKALLLTMQQSTKNIENLK